MGVVHTTSRIHFSGVSCAWSGQVLILVWIDRAVWCLLLRLVVSAYSKVLYVRCRGHQRGGNRHWRRLGQWHSWLAAGRLVRERGLTTGGLVVERGLTTGGLPRIVIDCRLR